jgi:hypothetical protein
MTIKILSEIIDVKYNLTTYKKNVSLNDILEIFKECWHDIKTIVLQSSVRGLIRLCNFLSIKILIFKFEFFNNLTYFSDHLNNESYNRIR